ncbi:glycosyltransferase family 25 protein [Acinetobacter sp. WZC-1]|uniref:glycosyltransferase family 25 protein n=1 Tax=Acinetobacter sp. WZC-1 TaxID=3459034 RepID=UPI00403DA36C
MKKYIISIEPAESPRISKLFAQKTFSQYRDDFKFFGVLGKALTVSEYFQQGVAGKQKPMTPGELGCTLSHVAALKDFLISDEAYAIIFEDDAIERFELNLDELEQRVRQLELAPCFLLSLGGIQMKICNRVRGAQLSDQLYDQKILKVDDDFLDNLSYAYAYIVDRKMAEMLIHYHQPPRIYDHWQDLLVLDTPVHFYATFVFDHPAIEQDENLSYLEQERKNMEVYGNQKNDQFRYLRKKMKKYMLKKYQLRG